MANSATVIGQDVGVASWQLRCFGGLKAVQGERVIERFRTQKTASLLALLALRGEQSRETICALLWPDAAPEAARSSLSTALSALRRDFGDGVLNADRYSVALSPGFFSTDVALFDAALKHDEFERAVELYQGQLLSGLYEEPFPALANEYEEKARRAFVTRLEELEGTPGIESSAAAVALARRAMALFGDDEKWFLALMRAHRAGGDLEAALRVYETLQRWTRKQGDVTSESARHLAKQLRRERDYQSSLPPDSPPLVAETEQMPTEGAGVSVPDFTSPNLPPQWTRFSTLR